MEFKDYYRTLNVSREAGAEDIKKAFRRLALQYHPDRNPGNTAEAEARFKEINEAYEILGNEYKRWQYDNMISRPGYARTVFNIEDFFNTEISEERYQEILRKFAGMDFIIRGMGWGKPWGCGGGKCRRQWRQDVE